MSIKEKLSLVYQITPYIFVAKNRVGLIFSILTGQTTHKIKLKDGIKISFKDYREKNE